MQMTKMALRFVDAAGFVDRNLYAPINVKREGGGGGRAIIGDLIGDVVFNVGNLLTRECPRPGSFECYVHEVGKGREFD